MAQTKPPRWHYQLRVTDAQAGHLRRMLLRERVGVDGLVAAYSDAHDIASSYLDDIDALLDELGRARQDWDK